MSFPTLHPTVVKYAETRALLDLLQDLRIEATWIEVSELKDNTPEKDAAIDLAMNINIINQELKKRIRDRIK